MSVTAALPPRDLAKVDLTKSDLQGRLQDAISVFNQVSHQLTRSYSDLEQRVGDLQQELAQTDKARLREHSAKKMLAERLDFIVNAMPVAVILLDGRGAVVQANGMAELLLGQTLSGRRWIDIIHNCFSPQPVDGHEMLLKNGRLVSVATQSLTHEPGQVIVISDQTETRRLQAKINHNRKLSEMGQMTASLAHQIRTPLATATLYADHLTQPQLSVERRIKFAEKLKDRLHQLERQVSDMLIFSKSGIAMKSVLSLSELVTQVYAPSEEFISAAGAIVSVEQSIPAGSVRCNHELLSSVFSNLIENAVQACQGAGIDPEINISCCLDRSRFVVVRITDNGPGFDDVNGDKLLEPFFTTKSSGTGLGLAVAAAVIDAHGGQFSIKNNADNGASAEITLPLLSADH